MKSLVFRVALLCLLFPTLALAQGSPGWTAGKRPTIGEWNAVFATKANANFGTLLSPTVSGTMVHSVNTTWSGGYPGTNNVGYYGIQSFAGTPTSRSYQDLNGYVHPLNLVEITDHLTVNPAFGVTVVGWDINMITGGSGAAGPRMALACNLNVVGDLAIVGGTTVSCANFFTQVSANLGGTSGAPTGDVYGLSVRVQPTSAATYLYSVEVAELDFSPLASNYQYSSALKLVNFGTLGVNAAVAGGDGAFEISGGRDPSNNPAATWRDWGILFGNPQNANAFPVSATGALIKSLAGTAAAGIDMHLSTLTNFLIGPGSLFYVEGATGRVHSNQIQSISGNSFAIGTITGDPMAVIVASSNTPATYPVWTSGTAASFDAGGVGGPVNVGPTIATLVRVGSATADQIMGSGAQLSALSATAGFLHLPYTNATSGAGGIPTGTPANTSGPACEWNDVTFVLNCWSPSASAWKHVAFSAAAG